jgi:dethiobiotin synthetase
MGCPELLLTMPRSTRFFVTGTDTGVGKTEVACALLSLMVEKALKPFAFKPCESGSSDDSERLQQAGGDWQKLSNICVYRFTHPLAPWLAAKRAGRRIHYAKLLSHYRTFGSQAHGVIEGAGGLHVPIDATHDVIDLVCDLKVPVLLVARAGLGTINHTTLSLLALDRLKVKVAAVALMQSSEVVDESIALNRAELERRFPRLTFLGPVGYEPEVNKRKALLRRHLKALLK